MTVGVLGGGQLGRMLALAGLNLDLRFRILDPSPEAPAAVAADHVVGEYDDYAALADFVRGLDLVTYEFENVPVKTARWLADRVPVYPPPLALEVSQDRLAEKTVFQKLGLPVPGFAAVETRAQFDAALAEIGRPAVLKTRRFGYDGKGQFVIDRAEAIDAAWERLGGRLLILERLIAFDRELSVLAVRGQDGTTVTYPLIQNTHRDGILRRSEVRPNEVDGMQSLAEEYAGRLLAALGYVGVLAIEFFQFGDTLLLNEMAPRVHNSGHWTIEGANTSQFENHLRAVTGLPLGETRVPLPCAMVNLIGRLPDPATLLAIPGTRLHVYGKAPRPNRKLGHVTVTAPEADSLDDRLRRVEAAISG